MTGFRLYSKIARKKKEEEKKDDDGKTDTAELKQPRFYVGG